MAIIGVVLSTGGAGANWRIFFLPAVEIKPPRDVVLHSEEKMLFLLTLAICVAAVAAFVASGLWYSVLFGGVWRSLAPRTSPSGFSAWQSVAQLLRNLIVAAALYELLRLTGSIKDVRSSLFLVALIWFGFQAMAISGAVIHEGYSPVLFAIHAGDALVSTVLMGAVLSLWPGLGGAISAA